MKKLHPLVLKLRLLRREMGLTQAQLAAKAGYGVKTVNHWECGHRSPGLIAVDHCLNAMGYRIEFVPIREEIGS